MLLNLIIFPDCSTESYRKSDDSIACAILLADKLSNKNAVEACQAFDASLVSIDDDVVKQVILNKVC